MSINCLPALKGFLLWSRPGMSSTPWSHWIGGTRERSGDMLNSGLFLPAWFSTCLAQQIVRLFASGVVERGIVLPVRGIEIGSPLNQQGLCCKDKADLLE